MEPLSRFDALRVLVHIRHQLAQAGKDLSREDNLSALRKIEDAATILGGLHDRLEKEPSIVVNWDESNPELQKEMK